MTSGLEISQEVNKHELLDLVFSDNVITDNELK